MNSEPMSRSRAIRRTVLRVAGVLFALLLLASGAFYMWAATPLGPSTRALAALDSDDIVTVTRGENRIDFEPSGDESNVGVILYPGGRVDYRSYAPLAREIASLGYLVSVVEMPLSLAVFSPDRADDVMAAHPEVMTWCIGGHSLGGAMAAQFAGTYPDSIDALVLLAAYPPGSTDLSDSEILVTSIVGNNDQVISADNLEDSIKLLPESTVFEVLQGGNHAQFGSYGEQPGDGEASMPEEEQQLQTARAIALLLRPLRLRSLSQ